MTKNASDGVGDLDDMAQRIGFSTQALQEWGYVAKMNGMELDVLQTGMKTFTTAMDGSSAAGVAACKKLGISIEGLSNEEAFNVAITALQGVTDETEKMALATDLFGAKAAQKMMPMLKQTAADTEALKQKANELGLVYSEDMVAAATTFGDTWDTLGMVFQSVGAQIATALMPILTEIINVVIENMPLIQAAIQSILPEITSLFEQLVPIIEQILPILTDAIIQLAPLLLYLLPPLIQLIVEILPPIIDLLNIVIPIIVSIIEWVATLIAGISDGSINILQIITDLAASIGEWLASLWEAFTTWLSNLWTNISTWFSNLITNVGDWFSGIWDNVSAFFTSIWEGLTSFFTNAWTALTTFFEPLITYFTTQFELIKSIFTGIVDFIVNVFTGNWGAAWEGVKSIFTNIATAIGNAFKAPINFIIGVINGFIDGLNKIKVPDWVPGIGGKGINIAKIPMLAKGGDIQLSGAAIVGEAGPEILELPRGAKVSPLKEGEGVGGSKTNNITQNNYFTQKELSPYQAQLEVKRLSRNLAGAF